jgi:hypothetical protein
MSSGSTTTVYVVPRERSNAVSKRLLILIVGVALVIAATAVTSTGAAPTTRSAVPASLVGTWGKTISLATWHKYYISDEPGGLFTIKITKGGLTKMYAPGVGFFTTMPVSASGTSIVFGPTADGACAGKAYYKWKVSERRLTMKLVTDHCDPRRVLLGVGAFTRR